MKTTIYILLILIGLLSCKAQQIYPMEADNPVDFNSGVYYKDINNTLDKYEGTWEYQDTNIRLKVVLEKIDHFAQGDQYSDVIVGNVIYEENGVEIINTLTNPSTTQGSDDIYHVRMFFIRDVNIIGGVFEDPIRSKWTRYGLYLTYSENYPTLNGPPQPQLEWAIRIRSFYNPDNDPNAAQASRVPRLLLLDKI